ERRDEHRGDPDDPAGERHRAKGDCAQRAPGTGGEPDRAGGGGQIRVLARVAGLDLDDGPWLDEDPSAVAVQAPAEVDVCGDGVGRATQLRRPAVDLLECVDVDERTDAR